MKPMYISIRQQETGCRIKQLLADNGYTVKDVQGAMGFENPQAIYKWISGKSLPSIDNLVILTRLLHTSIENILVLDEDVVRFTNFTIPKKEFSAKKFCMQRIFGLDMRIKLRV